MISKEIINYIPEYDKSLYTTEQLQIIDNALDMFNTIAKDRDEVVRQTKDDFMHNILNPKYSAQQMNNVLNAEISLFNYITFTLKHPEEKEFATLLNLIEERNNAIENSMEEKIYSETNNDDIDLDVFF